MSAKGAGLAIKVAQLPSCTMRSLNHDEALAIVNRGGLAGDDGGGFAGQDVLERIGTYFSRSLRGYPYAAMPRSSGAGQNRWS